MSTRKAIWMCIGVACVLTAIFSHPIIWVPLVGLAIWGVVRNGRAGGSGWVHGDGEWHTKDGVRHRWVQPKQRDE